MALRLRQALRATLRPKFTRGGHSASHGSEGQATLFGEPPLAAGQSRKWADWEPYHYAFLVGTLALTLLATQRPNTNPRDWARDEAEERERRRAAGLPVEYGVNYAGLRYLKERGALSEEDAEALEGGAIPAAYKPATRYTAALK